MRLDSSSVPRSGGGAEGQGQEVGARGGVHAKRSAEQPHPQPAVRVVPGARGAPRQATTAAGQPPAGAPASPATRATTRKTPPLPGGARPRGPCAPRSAPASHARSAPSPLFPGFVVPPRRPSSPRTPRASVCVATTGPVCAHVVVVACGGCRTGPRLKRPLASAGHPLPTRSPDMALEALPRGAKCANAAPP